MPLTPDQILAIQEIIELHHYAYIANTLGHDALPDEVIADLNNKGLLSDESLDLVKQAYLYGQSISKLGDKSRNMNYKQFETYVNQNPIPLTQMEQRAVAMAQVNAGQYCRGLGNTIEKDTGAVLIEADKNLRIQFEDKIKTAVAMNRAKRETIEKLKSDLGWSTQDWARDLKRIAVTEIINATQEGQADYLRKKYGGDSYVARIPNPGACKECLRLHIGSDGQPRIFKLSTLEKHGNNVGKKAADWQAIVGAVHPHCVCSMIRVPTGWGFDEQGELVPGGELGIKYEEPKELELALKEENDLRKSLKVKQNIVYQGIPIAIETPEGSIRSWINADGSIGETTMTGASYGYVKNTTSMDEEELDVFVGPYSKAPMVYVIDQRNPDTDLYDEQKCMLGFKDEDHARAVYSSNYTNSDDFVLVAQSMTLDQFKRWCGFELKTDEVKKSNFASETLDSNRSPGPGLGVNFFIPVPAKQVNGKNKGNELESKDLFSDIADNPESIYADIEDYEFANTVIPVHPLVIPLNYREGQIDARDGTAKNKEQVEKELKRRARQAVLPVGLKKGGPYIGPRGGKWADPEHTIPWEETKAKPKPKTDYKKPGSQLPQDVQQKLIELKIDKIPQSTIPVDSIRVDFEGDVDSKAVIAWKDTKGKWQSGYTPKFHENSAKKKWDRINRFREKVPGILKDIDKRMQASEPGSTEHQGLTILAIIGETGLRPGSTKSVQSHGHYGISTLLKDHVKIEDGKAVLSFVGKSGKDNKTVVGNKTTVAAIQHYLDNKEKGEALFNPNSMDISKQVLLKGMKVKDFRTIKATDTAEKLIAKVDEPPPLTGDEKKDKKLLAQALYETSKKVATVLNNTPAIARASYIHPMVFEKWASAIGASRSLWENV